jgi:type-F conjugative transfer system pilin assembly protein TrbC
MAVLAGLALLLGSAAPADQEPPPARPGARAAISAQGKAAMERLKAATEHRRDQAIANSPALPPTPDAATARRAFDGYRKRAPSPALDARARVAVQAGEARMAADREAMASRLRQALGLEAPEMAAITKAVPAPAPRAWVPLLFVSSSMPVAVLRSYAQQLERVKGVLAFRGMPGGLARVGPMARLSAEILRIDPGCSGPNCAMRAVQLIVDPIVFRQHGITRVPALAMIPGDPVQPYCERDAQSPHSSHLVFGDSALSGLFEEYARLGGKEEVQNAQSMAAR